MCVRDVLLDLLFALGYDAGDAKHSVSLDLFACEPVMTTLLAVVDARSTKGHPSTRCASRRLLEGHTPAACLCLHYRSLGSLGLAWPAVCPFAPFRSPLLVSYFSVQKTILTHLKWS